MKTSILFKIQFCILLFFVVVLNCDARLDETVTQCSIRYGKSNLDNELEKSSGKKKEITAKFTTPNKNGFIFREYEKNNIKICCVFLKDKCVKIEYQDTVGMENDIKQLYPGIKEIKISEMKQEYRPYIENNSVVFGAGKSFAYNLVSMFQGNGFYIFIYKGRIQVVADKYYDSIINNKPKQPEPKPKSKEGL